MLIAEIKIYIITIFLFISKSELHLLPRFTRYWSINIQIASNSKQIFPLLLSCIRIKSSPVLVKARRLHLDEHQAGKSGFENMISQGVVRPSKSPLHIVWKKNRDWGPYWDCCALKEITIPDRYPMLHMHYFLRLRRRKMNKKIFSKLKIVRAYNQKILLSLKIFENCHHLSLRPVRIHSNAFWCFKCISTFWKIKEFHRIFSHGLLNIHFAIDSTWWKTSFINLRFTRSLTWSKKLQRGDGINDFFV